MPAGACSGRRARCDQARPQQHETEFPGSCRIAVGGLCLAGCSAGAATRGGVGGLASAVLGVALGVGAGLSAMATQRPACGTAGVGLLGWLQAGETQSGLPWRGAVRKQL